MSVKDDLKLFFFATAVYISLLAEDGKKSSFYNNFASFYSICWMMGINLCVFLVLFRPDLPSVPSTESEQTAEEFWCQAYGTSRETVAQVLVCVIWLSRTKYSLWFPDFQLLIALDYVQSEKVNLV